MGIIIQGSFLFYCFFPADEPPQNGFEKISFYLGLSYLLWQKKKLVIVSKI